MADGELRLQFQISDESYWTYVEETRLNAVLRILPRVTFSSVLDLGCGKGQFLLGLCRKLGIARASGVDGSKESILEARERGVNASVLDLNHETLPFSDSKFDLVLLLETLEHLEDGEHCLDEARRVLQPGATLVVSTPNIASWHGRISLALGFQPLALDVGRRKHYGGIVRLSGKSTGHIRGFTLRTLLDLLSTSGFEVASVSSAPAFATGDAMWLRPLRFVDRRMSRFPDIASGVVIGARRTR
jgi:methionine biosynthesis protein MetW